MPSSYPLDTTGLQVSNRVTNELHTFTEVNNSRYRIIIPNFAPFYLDNLSLTHESSAGVFTPLIENQHFMLALPYIGATRSIGKMLYGGISFNTNFVNGTIHVTYQTIGGDWTASSAYVLERLATMVYNPRTTVWDIVTDKPSAFPPINHDQNLDYIYGHQELITAVNDIAAQITNRPVATKATIGLGNVVNLPLATDAEVMANATVEKYVTMRQIALINLNQALQAQVTNLESSKANVTDLNALVGIVGTIDATKATITSVNAVITRVIALENSGATTASLASIDAQITSILSALNNKADIGHLHTIANVTGLQTALDGKTNNGHGHALIDITGLQAALDAKAAVDHLHTEYAAVAHSHTTANITGLDTTLANLAAQIAAGGGSGSGTTSVTGTMVVLTSSQTWTVPANVSAIKVTVIGGGQAGGNAPGGTGGSSGSSGVSYFNGLTAGQQFTVILGAGGSVDLLGGVGQVNSSVGGNTSIASGSSYFASANGGGNNGVQAQLNLGYGLGTTSAYWTYTDPDNSNYTSTGYSRGVGGESTAGGNYFGGGGNTYHGSSSGGYVVAQAGNGGAVIIEYMFAGSSGSGGSGTVTSVGVAGTSGRITSSGGPVTSAGTVTLDLATTGVIAGSYTNVNMTVDDYGRVTAVSNGSSDGGGSGSSGVLLLLTTSQVWTVPAGVSKLKITAVGGGGHGGAYDPNTESITYTGGGGGGVCITNITNATAGATLNITVASANGTTIVNSSLLTADMTAGGGSVGNGGNSYGGQLNLSGDPGQLGVYDNIYNVDNNSYTPAKYGGNGGSAPGFGGAGRTQTNGTSWGAGGGGHGGLGYQGLVIIEF